MKKVSTVQARGEYILKHPAAREGVKVAFAVMSETRESAARVAARVSETHHISALFSRGLCRPYAHIGVFHDCRACQCLGPPVPCTQSFCQSHEA